MQAIITKFLGPTNTKGSRVKASCSGGSVVVPYDHELSSEQNHDAAALKLVEKMGWSSGSGDRFSTLARGGTSMSLITRHKIVSNGRSLFEVEDDSHIIGNRVWYRLRDLTTSVTLLVPVGEIHSKEQWRVIGTTDAGWGRQ